MSAQGSRWGCSLSLGRGKKGKITSSEVGYLYSFIQARRGDSRPNDQAEHREGSGRLHVYREVCGSDKEADKG